MAKTKKSKARSKSKVDKKRIPSAGDVYAFHFFDRYRIAIEDHPRCYRPPSDSSEEY